MIYVAGIYVTGFVISFLAGCFICERVDGRVCTGEADFEQALGFALLWPLVLAIVTSLFIAFKFKGKPS